MSKQMKKLRKTFREVVQEMSNQIKADREARQTELKQNQSKAEQLSLSDLAAMANLSDPKQLARLSQLTGLPMSTLTQKVMGQIKRPAYYELPGEVREKMSQTEREQWCMEDSRLYEEQQAAQIAKQTTDMENAVKTSSTTVNATPDYTRDAYLKQLADKLKKDGMEQIEGGEFFTGVSEAHGS